MSDRSDFPDEQLDHPDQQDTDGVRGVDALGVMVVVIFLAAVGLITFLLTSAVALT